MPYRTCKATLFIRLFILLLYVVAVDTSKLEQRRVGLLQKLKERGVCLAKARHFALVPLEGGLGVLFFLRRIVGSSTFSRCCWLPSHRRPGYHSVILGHRPPGFCLGFSLRWHLGFRGHLGVNG